MINVLSSVERWFSPSHPRLSTMEALDRLRWNSRPQIQYTPRYVGQGSAFLNQL